MYSSSPALRVAAFWLLGLTLAVAAGIVTIFVVSTSLYSPERQVEKYLQALEDGDGAEALGLLQATVPTGNPAMLDGPGLQTAVDAVEGIDIGDPEPAGDQRVKLPVHYTVDDNALTTSFMLQKVDTVWLFFDEWEFVPSTLPTVTASVVNGDHATINGEQVGLPGGEASFAVFYPGQYTATYDTKYFAAEPEEVTVSTRQDSSTSQLTLAAKPTQQLIDDVEASLREYLDECAEQDVFYPDNCPFSHPGTPFLAPGADISWEVSEYPTVEIAAFDGEWVMKPLTGTAVVRSEQIDTFSGAVTPLEAEHEFRFTARLSVNEDSISVTPVVD